MTAAASDMLVNRVRKRARHLRKWSRREGVSCYRIYDRDIPEIPLTIDWYDGALYVAELSREDEEVDTRGLAMAVAGALEVAARDVHVKQRRRQKGSAQYERLADSGTGAVVEEGGHRFRVNLSDYLDTGLFLDHRMTRAMVAAEAAGKRLLNLFCYTASFTVYAAAAGARSSVSVDLSNTYLSWARENFELNGLDERRHRLLRADVIELLAAPPPDLGRFDLAVLDPPTFSNSKAMREILDVQRDHDRLINDTLALLDPGGVLYFSTNRRRFGFDAALPPGATADEITQRTTPPDFRLRPHRAWRITVADAGAADRGSTAPPR